MSAAIALQILRCLAPPKPELPEANIVSQSTTEQIVDAKHLGEVADELERARAKFGAIASLHEGYAVILEELDEFWEGVKTKGADPEAMRRELIQVAAMAIRTATDRLA